MVQRTRAISRLQRHDHQLPARSLGRRRGIRLGEIRERARQGDRRRRTGQHGAGQERPRQVRGRTQQLKSWVRAWLSRFEVLPSSQLDDALSHAWPALSLSAPGLPGAPGRSRTCDPRIRSAMRHDRSSPVFTRYFAIRRDLARASRAHTDDSGRHGETAYDAESCQCVRHLSNRSTASEPAAPATRSRISKSAVQAAPAWGG